MNLEQYNTVEINLEDQQLIEGGLIPALLALAGAGFYFGWELGREYAKNH